MFLCYYLRPIISLTLVAFRSVLSHGDGKKPRKFRRVHILFNLLILCAIQQGPVKVCSCYLIIISAALTAASLPHWRSFPFKQGKQNALILLKNKCDDWTRQHIWCLNLLKTVWKQLTKRIYAWLRSDWRLHVRVNECLLPRPSNDQFGFNVRQ